MLLIKKNVYNYGIFKFLSLYLNKFGLASYFNDCQLSKLFFYLLYKMYLCIYKFYLENLVNCFCLNNITIYKKCFFLNILVTYKKFQLNTNIHLLIWPLFYLIGGHIYIILKIQMYWLTELHIRRDSSPHSSRPRRNRGIPWIFDTETRLASSLG